ncbi:MAG: hypothetical protein ABJO36_10140 [Litorimonas sp.]
MTDEDAQKKYDELMDRGLNAETKFTRIIDRVFDIVGAGFGGWLFWTFSGAMDVSLFQQLFWTLIGAAIGVVAMRVFFFVGQFFW